MLSLEPMFSKSHRWSQEGHYPGAMIFMQTCLPCCLQSSPIPCEKVKLWGGDNDMEVSMSISLRPALYATPHLNNLHHKKRTVPTECPRPITVNGDVYIFSSSLFVWNQLWEPSPRLNTLANILLIWLENKPTRYVDCSIEMREWHKPQTFTHTNTLSETVTV